jgi:hypothetical protein
VEHHRGDLEHAPPYGCVNRRGEDGELVVPDARAWREWLGRNHADCASVMLVLAKKGTTSPTSLTYDQALEEAICFGWIDGQVRRRDERTYFQRFTPRRARSRWSKRNTTLAERLISDGRMHASGIAEVERAKADGRWDAAYAGPRNCPRTRRPGSRACGRTEGWKRCSNSSAARIATRSCIASRP